MYRSPLTRTATLAIRSTAWRTTTTTSQCSTRHAIHAKAGVTEGVVPVEGIQRVRETAKAKFDESFDIALQLGLDPRKPNQSINGLVPLPHGSGKKVKVAVFATGSSAAEAREAGADLVGGAELVQQLIAKEIPIDFSRSIASPEMLPVLKQAARLLGPKGLMPNKKNGTVTEQVGDAVVAAKKGAVPVKTDRFGIVRAGIGKMSFEDSMLEDNLRAFLIAMRDQKPDGAKGKYMLSCYVASTMGKGVKLHIKSCDPSSNYFMIDADMLAAEKVTGAKAR